ncbi:MAG TPA: glycosyl hydrolase [Solirubrobacterales bacterium]|jgi:hypothetical protein|nr:glycosyl hydrolase [Solirubrobacterales bacterium]
MVIEGLRKISWTTRALALAVALVCAASLWLAAAAQALPAKFWGAVPQASLSGEQYERLGDGGVASVRLAFDWGALQSSRGAAVDWSGPDTAVERAVLAGIEVLPTVTGVPSWAVPTVRVSGGGGSQAPAHLPASGAAASAWKKFLAQAVERYGPNGDFWATHPALPVRPLRAWQVFNEPNFKYFVAKPNPTEYGALVKISSAVIKAVDPGAQVVLAGLFSKPKGSRTASGKHKSLNWWASDFLTKMYKTSPGIKSRFTGVALHPYAIYAREIPALVTELRAVLTANHDSSKGLWITELGWSSQKPTRSNLFAKGVSGQAQQLTSAFNALRSNQAKWRVQRVYWFSVDDASGVCNFCDGSGLFGEGFVPKKAWYEYVKFAGGTP